MRIMVLNAMVLMALPLHAYQLDSTCKQYEDKLIMMFDSAFAMNDLAIDTIRRIPYTKEPEKGDGLKPWQRFTWLGKWAFDDEGYTANQALSNTKTGVIKRFEHVATMRTKVHKANANDVVVFCDTTRLSIRNLRLFDSSIKAVLNWRVWGEMKKDAADVLAECNAVNTKGDNVNNAISYGSPDRPFFIQLCPWWLNVAVHTTPDWSRATWIEFISRAGDQNAIDFLHDGWMPAKLLHELTHTETKSFHLPTYDTQLGDALGGTGTPYGWTQVVKKAVNYLNPELTRNSISPEAIDNADNYSYYALGCRIINADKSREKHNTRITKAGNQARLNLDGSIQETVGMSQTNDDLPQKRDIVYINSTAA